MASLFPSQIDTFANPLTVKTDGEDVVKAQHVNDLQDSVIAAQTFLNGNSVIFNYGSNFYIADNTSIRTVVEVLDDELNRVEVDLQTLTAAHFAEFIPIDPFGNMTSGNVQEAVYELQADIDNILGVGSITPTSTLDYRFVNTSGADTMQGPLTVQDSIIVEGPTTLGSLVGDAHNWTGNFNITGDVNHIGDTQITGDVYLATGNRIADVTDPASSYILFESDRFEFYSFKDFQFRLDSDSNESGQFVIKNGLDQDVMRVDETGAMWSLLSLSTETISASNSLWINSATEITEDKIDIAQSSLHIQLDKDGLATGERFTVTKNGDTGANLASSNLLLDVDEDAVLTSGINRLKSGVQETGYLGFRTYSPNAGGVFFGYAVNFKSEMTNSPAGVNLTIDENINAQNISVTGITKYGFFVEFDSVAVGEVKIRGTYTTLGN
jgi:hypothetical protein